MTLICRETTLSSVIDAAMNTSVLGTTCLSSEQCHMQMLLQTSRILLHQERVRVSMWPGQQQQQAGCGWWLISPVTALLQHHNITFTTKGALQLPYIPL